jgi:hypothetical protein
MIGKLGFEVLKADVISQSICFCFKEKENKTGFESVTV